MAGGQSYRDQIRMVGAIRSERLDGFHRNLHSPRRGMRPVLRLRRIIAAHARSPLTARSAKVVASPARGCWLDEKQVATN